ncbi:hypothetical protein [Microbacterium sp. VKM Ac-2923]|uniref:hypothetical protein n=1 Tax=Microbacterium sp. VKM Ac-2923 TaxID=2929476 RepID=UPI001FB42404|nr:hypothetical protein [Microbacterium sp. VKM Ac-2923]MCJ1709277.1 hypothetical protein [Microbacterium sp. VKM Ac-2923]
MTDNTKPRIVSMSRDGHSENYRLSDGREITSRIDWTPEDAASGLVDEWADQAEISTPRRIRTADGKLLGVLLTADDYEEGCDAIRRVNSDAYGDDSTSYRPFGHSPSSFADRLINTDGLERVMKNLIHGADAEISKQDADSIHYGALVAAIQFTFDPDSRGLVPVMTPGRATDGTVQEYYWSFLYPTPVAGLFLRPDDDFIAGTNYTLTAGSGYTLVGGYWDKGHTEALAVKLGEALPGLNWFTVKNGDLTSEIKKTATGIIREHGRYPKEA